MTKTREISDILTGVDIEGTITATGSISSTPQGTLWGTANDGSGSGLDADTVDGLHGTDIVETSNGVSSDLNTNLSAQMFGFSTGTANRPQNYGQGLTIVSDGKTQNNSSNWATQIAFGTDENSMYFRGKTNAGSWNSWHTVWHTGNDGSGSGLNADLLDGYHASTTRNAPNTIPIRDASGYLQLGWINTTSGATTSTINKIYASFDDYIRYVTPATLISQLGLWTSSNDGAGSGLDADTVDGLQASQFLRSDAADTAVKLTFGTGNVQAPTPSDATTGARLNLYPTGNGSDYSIGIESNAMWFNSDLNYKWYVDGSLKFEWDNAAGQFEIGGNKVWNAGNDGAGSGLDADTVDGIQGSSFLRSDADDTMTGALSIAPASGFARLEIGGPSGAYMDFKSPFSDDYDGRIIYDGSNFVVGTGLNQPVILQHNNSTKLTTTTTGINVTGELVASGNVTAFSDERLKDNIETLDGSKVYEMRGVSYTKNGEASSGVIAQELQKVAPELVNDSGEYLSVAYGNLVGYLIEAVKELKAEVEQLKSEK